MLQSTRPGTWGHVRLSGWMRTLAASFAFVVALLGAERWALAADGGAPGLQLLVSENSSGSNEVQE